MFFCVASQLAISHEISLLFVSAGYGNQMILKHIFKKFKAKVSVYNKAYFKWHK